MVFFSCDGCNEVLKKNQVDGHANRCRSCHAVSCVDCNVSFPGDEYRSHTTCVTEAERYEKRTPAAKSSQHGNSKATPQQQWKELIERCQDRAPAHLQNYLRTMSQLDNVPRKEKQFRNFTANSLNLRGKGRNGEKIVSDIWELLKAEREQQREASAATAASGSANPSDRTTSEPPPTEEPTCYSVRKSSEEAAKAVSDDEPSAEPATVAMPPSADSAEQSTASSPKKPNSDKERKKTVKKAIKSLLKKAKDRCMTLKELRRAVRKQLTNLPKTEVKVLVQDAASQQKSFLLEGQVVKLASGKH